MTALGLALAVAPGITPAPATAVTNVEPGTPVLGMSPAIAGDGVAALAWAAHTATGEIRVRVALPAGATSRQLGPAGSGDDGAPALAEIDSGRFVVVTARGAFGRSHLWWSLHDGSDWSRPGSIASPWRHNHHPTLASEGGRTWLAWVASNPGDRGETLVATRWVHGRWGPVEIIPGAPGTPMAPHLALLDGRPAVVWAASDGNDAEIWISTRIGGAWSRATALSDNTVPDIDPTVASFEGGAALAWAQFRTDGYRPMWRRGDRRGRHWSRTRPLDSRPGSNPIIVTGPGGTRVAWASTRPDSAQSEVRSVRVSGPRTGAVRRIARVPNARIAASGSLFTWSTAAGPGAARLVGSGDEEVRLRAISGVPVTPVSLRIQPSLPGTYRGFGDSITDGVVITGGEITFTEGYPAPLGSMLSALLDRTVVVVNDGRAGETTPEGLERLAGVVLTNPKLFNLLMEGTNDVSDLTDVQTIVTNLRAMVRRIQSASGIVVLGTLLPRVNEGDDGVRNAHTDAVNAAIVTMAAEEGAMLVDQNAAFQSHPELFSDRLHPTPEGYQHMAGVWFRALQPILTQLLQQQDTDDDLARALLQQLAPGQRRIR